VGETTCNNSSHESTKTRKMWLSRRVDSGMGARPVE
jgi:hypothetical protein